MADGMHEMGFAEPDPAIKIKRIKRNRILGFRHAAGGGMGQLIGLADDEIIKSEPRIERRHQGGIGARRFGHARGFVLKGLVCLRKADRGFLRDTILAIKRLYSKIDAFDGAVGRAPELAKPVGVVVEHPVPKEPGRQRQRNGIAVNLVQFDILEPGIEGCFAIFGA